MRYELSDDEWTVIEPMLPDMPRGVPRVVTTAWTFPKSR
jgi:transposase